MDRKIRTLVTSLTVLLCCACGGGSDQSNQNPEPLSVSPDAYGIIVDAEVSGLKYISGDYSGTTEENGRFGYMNGETISFFVGDIRVGYEVMPKETLTPYDLAEENAFVALNIARFLQSLDDDLDLNNGIQIHNSSHTLAKGESIDFLSQEWSMEESQNTEIEQLLYKITRAC